MLVGSLFVRVSWNSFVLFRQCSAIVRRIRHGMNMSRLRFNAKRYPTISVTSVIFGALNFWLSRFHWRGRKSLKQRYVYVINSKFELTSLIYGQSLIFLALSTTRCFKVTVLIFANDLVQPAIECDGRNKNEILDLNTIWVSADSLLSIGQI